MASAVAITQQYTEHPSAFPVSTPLPRPLPAGTVFGWLQCSSPICAAETPLFRAAATAIGARLIVATADPSAQGSQTAFSSLLAQKPTAIILPAIVPQEVAPQIQQAHSSGIPLVSAGQMNYKAAGLDANTFGNAQALLAGKLLADYVVTKGTRSDVVFYTTNELSFLSVEKVGFTDELSKVCPGCQQRVVDIPIADYGTSAPQLVVSDLTSHPSTTLAVFGASSAATGLVTALNTAGIRTPFIGASLSTGNLQDLQQGNMEAGLASDFPLEAWTEVDMAARLVLKAPLTTPEQQQSAVIQWLSKSNLSGVNVSNLWTGYPDYAALFRKLWTVK